MEQQKDIIQQFRQQQEKFTYYILALSIAAIGFSIVRSSGLSLHRSQIPLGAAVLAWGVSSYCGITFLRYCISNLYANSAYFDVLSGNHPKVGNHPQLIKAAASGVKEAMETNSDRASLYSKWQLRLFYSGIALYLSWHVYEMYIRQAK